MVVRVTSRVSLVQTCGLRHCPGRVLITDRLLNVAARADGRAQHRRRYRTPDGQQYGQQNEQPEAKGLHSSIVRAKAWSGGQTGLRR